MHHDAIRAAGSRLAKVTHRLAEARSGLELATVSECAGLIIDKR